LLELLCRILSNRGIQLVVVNPAYSSLIGLVKYSRMYGLASDEAAALVIARRGMRLSERLPRSLTAYPFVKKGKHVWSAWNQLNNLIKSWDVIQSRHDYYSISVPNWESLVKPQCESSDWHCGKSLTLRIDETWPWCFSLSDWLIFERFDKVFKSGVF